MAKILIVDDDKTIGLMYAKVLSRQGNAVILADSVMQGWESIRAAEFDYVFVDLRMPDFDGLNFIKRAHIKANHPHTKVIVLTNSESPKLMKQAQALGVDRYLIKVDYSPHGLAQVIAKGQI